MEAVSGRKSLFGRQGSLTTLLLRELALRQWWWAFGWYGCSIGWWEPPGGSSGVHAARWPPWGESGSAGIQPDKASCPWRLLEAPSSSLGAALPGGGPCSATAGEKRGRWGKGGCKEAEGHIRCVFVCPLLRAKRLAPCYCGYNQTAEVHTPSSSGAVSVCLYIIKAAKDVCACVWELLGNVCQPELTCLSSYQSFTSVLI